MRQPLVREMTACAMLTAILCVVAPFNIPLVQIPVTLATFVVMCIGGIAGCRRGLIAVGLYLALGAVGVPVFAGLRGGAAVLVGPTGGYLLGYLLLVAVAGIVSDKSDSRAALCVAFVSGTVLVYLVGTLLFLAVTKRGLAYALGACVLPFLPFDAVKIAVATAISPKLKKSLQSIEQR